MAAQTLRPGGPLGETNALGTIRSMLEQSRPLPLPLPLLLPLLITENRHVPINQKRNSQMAQATVKNQLKIIANEKTIIANQKKILRNQDRLAQLLGNQVRIIRNQQAILKNQKKILATPGRSRGK
jgi:hypothetical protein